MATNIPLTDYHNKEEVFYRLYTGQFLEPEHNNSCINNPYTASVHQLLPVYHQPHFEQLLRELNLHEYIEYFTYEWDRYAIPTPNHTVYVKFILMIDFFNVYHESQSDMNDADLVIQTMINNMNITTDDTRSIARNIYEVMHRHYRYFITQDYSTEKSE